MHYILQWDSTVGGIAWEHAFDMHSDEMAADYASRILANQPECVFAYAKQFFLFRPDDGVEGGKLVCRLSINKLTVNVNVGRKA